MKLKQADGLLKNDELIKSIEQLDNSKVGFKDYSYENLSRPLEVSDAKRSIINEIDEAINKNQRKGLIEVIKNTQEFREDNSPFGSPLNPSIDSSNLY